MPAPFQILPVSQRPTIYDAVGQLLSSIQGNQYAAQQAQQQQSQAAAQQAHAAAQQASEDEKTQYDRNQQHEQDAYDRAHDASEAAAGVLQDKVDAIRGIDDLTQQRAAYASASPDVQQAFGYDPRALPLPAAPAPAGPKPMGTGEKLRLNLENDRFQFEKQQAAAKTAAAAAAPKGTKQSYDPTNVATFVEHPAVKKINDQLRALDSTQQRVFAGGFQVTDPLTKIQRPPTQAEIGQAMIPIRKRITDTLAERDTVVKNLRARGVKVAADPNDMSYVQQGSQQQATPPAPAPAPAPKGAPGTATAPTQASKQRPAFKQTGFVHLSDGRAVRGGTNDGKTFYDLTTGQQIK